MRISTSLLFQRGVDQMNDAQSMLSDTQSRISSGKRMLAPSDDPIAASRVVETTQALALNASQEANVGQARDSLSLVDSTLSGAGDLLQQIRTLLVQAGNTSLTDSDRASIAVNINSSIDALVGLANTRDGTGGYLFSGYQQAVQPFTRTTSGAQYNGDQGYRSLSVAPTRTLAVSENGTDIFERVRTGNGIFSTGQAAANTGTGVISGGTVTNGLLLTGDSYQIVFSVAGSATTYDIVDTTTSTTVSSGNPYTSDGAINFAGMQVTIGGAPANGDTFTVSPSANQSVFKTLTDAVNALSASVTTPGDRARLAQNIGAGLANIDQALDRLLGVRTSVGAKLKELDTLDSVNQDVNLNYTQQLSHLQDVDYAQAASDLARQQQALEAARASYQRVTGASLFDYL
jgi:flagellar hook-associated protein 3 FlgL